MYPDHTAEQALILRQSSLQLHIMKRVREFETVGLVVRDGQVSFRFEDGSTATAPDGVVRGSSVLSHALSLCEDGNEESVSVPRGILQSWLQNQQHTELFHAAFIQVLQVFMHAFAPSKAFQLLKFTFCIHLGDSKASVTLVSVYRAFPLYRSYQLQSVAYPASCAPTIRSISL